MIILKDINKTYNNGTPLHVLKGIDLHINKGEFVSIMGASGSGKSTLLNILGMLDNYDTGEYYLNGTLIKGLSETKAAEYRNRMIGFIFQSYNLMPNLNALENVEFIAEISKNQRDPMECLDLVGLQDRWDRYPSAMSGGQQQRVCIARVISKEPRIILADEPTAALDFETGQGVLKAIENIVRNDRKTVIMVTHNVEIAKMADRVIRLKDGLISSVRINFSPLHAEDLSW